MSNLIIPTTFEISTSNYFASYYTPFLIKRNLYDKSKTLLNSIDPRAHCSLLLRDSTHDSATNLPTSYFSGVKITLCPPHERVLVGKGWLDLKQQQLYSLPFLVHHSNGPFGWLMDVINKAPSPYTQSLLCLACPEMPGFQKHQVQLLGPLVGETFAS